MRKMYNKRIGDPSSEFGMTDGDERFEQRLRERSDRAESLWNGFVDFMQTHNVRPDELRQMFVRYHEEFLQ